jgi:CRISPR/Cas system-associated exonuclease Cas4 (RecB family)
MTVTLLDAKPESHNLLTLSVSKAKTYIDCNAKFWFGYIEKLPRKEWDFHVFGKFSHAILESFHLHRINGNKDSDAQLMYSVFNKSLKEWQDKLDSKQIEETRLIVKQYLELLKREREAGMAPQVLAVEKDFNINIDDRVLLNGFIDRVQLDRDGVMHVADYKTTKNKKYIKNDFLQLKTYAYVLCLEDPTLEVIRTSYIMLRHGFENITKEFTRKDIMKVEKVFLDYAAQIEQETLWRPNPTGLCSFCDYLSHCRSGRDFINAQKGFDKFGATDW